MPITITMPALSPTMTEGTLAKWHVKVGDAVAAGDVLAEIETDKATMEVEAVEEGKVARILVDEGTENVAVNAPIALLLEEEEDESALEDYEPKGGPPPAADDGEAPAEETPPVSEEPEAAPAAPTEARPREKGDGAADGRVFASPLARRMAAQADIDLAQLSGSGPHGRIVKRDIDAALAAGPGERPAPTAEAPAVRAAGPQQPLTEDYEEVSLNAMRKTIARRLTEAKQTVPHFYLAIDCAVDELLALRKRLNEKAEEKISVNDFVVRAAALALARHPDINAQWTDSAILRHRPIDVSVAVAIEGGLITPIIRNADQKGLATIAREMKELAGRAREGKLAPEEYQGGTFSVSNLGMFGIEEFIAVINPPQAAILAVGAGVQRPVVRDGAVAIATMMNLTLSADHRVFGGAEGAAFLATLRRFIEDPITMLL